MGILQQLRTLWSRLCVTLMPIIRRRRHPPNVLRSFQIDSAVSRLLWIDIHDVGYCPFACENDMNPDFHAYAQCDGCQNQGAMKVDDECFAFACQSLAHTERLDPNLKANPRTPSRLTINQIGGHTPSTHRIVIHRVARAMVTVSAALVFDFKHNERNGDVMPIASGVVGRRCTGMIWSISWQKNYGGIGQFSHKGKVPYTLLPVRRATKWNMSSTTHGNWA